MNRIQVIGFFLCSLPYLMVAQSNSGQDSLVESPKEVGAIITDRPDATESPNTVPRGFIQIETGAFYESFEKNSIKDEVFTYNTTLVRIGILENLEMRIGWDFAEGRTSIDNTQLKDIQSGFNPLLFGAKLGIAKEEGWFPEIGLLGHLYLPFTASNDYKTENTGVDFRFSFAHTLSERSGLSYNLGAKWRDDSPEASYIYTLSYGYGITEKLTAYVEIYGDLPENSEANHLWDGGLTYLLKDNFQLDATLGKSFTEGQDILLSAGFSIRFPH